MMKDYFGKDTKDLLRKKLFLFDMDGTIYRENMLFEGSLDLLEKIIKRDGKYVFITNNSSKSVKDYIEKVNNLGIAARQEHFFTASQAAILYLKQFLPDRLVYCQGTKSMIEELSEAGILVTEEVRDDVGAILVGFDTELTMEKIANTCRLLSRDIPYLATNPDLACPVAFGFIPDCGSICKMIENATGRKPTYIGKPEPVMVNIIMNRTSFSAEETVVIGDRLYTDIATGINAGVDTICVLSGEATCQDIIEGNIKPTYTFLSVKEISEAM